MFWVDEMKRNDKEQLKRQRLIYGAECMVVSLFIFSGTHNTFSTSFSGVMQIHFIRPICCANVHFRFRLKVYWARREICLRTNTDSNIRDIKPTSSIWRTYAESSKLRTCSYFIFQTTDESKIRGTNQWQGANGHYDSLLWSYENRLVVGKACIRGRGSTPSGRRCFQLTPLFAALCIVEHPNTDKFHLGCILFIQQFFSRRNICYPLLNKSLLHLFHGEGRVAPGEGHLFAAHFSNVSENYYNSQRERGKSLFVSFLQLKGISKLEKWL